MPYKNLTELKKKVSGVKNLPKHAQKIFIATVNNALKQYTDETRAYATAWAAVKKQYKKNKDDKWVKKGRKDKLIEAVDHAICVSAILEGNAAYITYNIDQHEPSKPEVINFNKSDIVGSVAKLIKETCPDLNQEIKDGKLILTDPEDGLTSEVSIDTDTPYGDYNIYGKLIPHYFITFEK